MLSLGCLLGATAAQAQTYPSKTITIVVTAAAGGVSDVVARAIGQRLAEAWGQQVVIENKGGGAHIIGAQQVAKAPPDGHTLLVAEAGTYVLNPDALCQGQALLRHREGHCADHRAGAHQPGADRQQRARRQRTCAS